MKLIDEIKNSKEFNNFQLLVRNNKLSHAYLIVSENDELNKKFCETITAFLLKKNDFPEFHPDIFIYPKGQNLIVDDSNEIIENSNIKPMMFDYKIFIINNIDEATVQAQNKLLKIVEDAPASVIYLFNTVNKNSVLQTIISRIQLIDLSNLIKEDLKQSKHYQLIIEMLTNMKSSRKVIDYVSKFANKIEFLEILKVMEYVFEEILYFNSGVNNGNIDVEKFASEFSMQAIEEIFKLIISARKQFEANVNLNLIIDNLLIKILEVKYYAK